MSATRDEMGHFFRARFPLMGDGETIEIRAFPSGGGRPRRRFCDSPAEAADFAASLPASYDIYYGLHLRLGDGGTKADVSSLTGLQADADDKHFASAQEAEDACLGLDLPPSWLIRSGHGYQPFWQFATPLGRDQLARVEHACRRLAFALGGLDAVQDASRIFRVPGTWNNKEPQAPVTLELETGRTYTLEQLEGMLPALPPVAHNPRQSREHTDEDGEADPEFVRVLLTFIDPCQAYAINTSIWMAVAFYFPGEEGEALVDAWCSDARIANGQHSCPRNEPTKHASFRRARGNVAAMGTLIHYAKLGGWRPEPQAEPLRPTTGGRVPAPPEPPPPLPASPVPDELPRFVRGAYAYLGGGLTGLIDRDFTTQMILCGLSQFLPGWRVENLGLNLWGLGVAASGGGKNVVTDALVGLFLAVPRHAPLYTTGSPEGLLRLLHGDGQTCCFYQDEWGDFYTTMGKEYMTGMAGTFCGLHDGRPVAHRLTRNSVVITNPHVVMLATTTPAKLVEKLKGEDIDGGLIGRLWITLPKTFSGHITHRLSPVIKAELAEALGQHLLDLEGLVPDKRCVFYQELPDELAALEADLGIGTGDWRSFEEEVADPRRARGRHITRWKVIAAGLEIWKARPEVADGQLLITPASCRLALALVRRAVADQTLLLSYVGGSEDAKALDRIRRGLVRAGQEGLTRSGLLRVTHIKAQDLSRLLNIMEDAKQVEEGIGAGGTLVYRHTGRAAGATGASY